MNLIYKDLFEKSENITIFTNKLEKVNEFKIQKKIYYQYIFSINNINYIYYRYDKDSSFIEGEYIQRYIINNDLSIKEDIKFNLELGTASHNFRFFNLNNINYGIGGQHCSFKNFERKKTNKQIYLDYNKNATFINTSKYNIKNNVIGNKIFDHTTICPYFSNGLHLFEFLNNDLMNYSIKNNKLPIINGLKNGRSDKHTNISIFDCSPSILYDNKNKLYYLYHRANVNTGIRNIQYCTSSDLINWSNFNLIKLDNIIDINKKNIYYTNFFKIQNIEQNIAILPINDKLGNNYKALSEEGVLSLYYSNKFNQWEYVGDLNKFKYHEEWFTLGSPIIKNNNFYFYNVKNDTNIMELYKIPQNRLSYAKSNNNLISKILFKPFILKNNKIIINFKTFKKGYIKFQLLDSKKTILNNYSFSNFNLINENIDSFNFELLWNNNSLIENNNQEIYLELEGTNFELYSIYF
jgi:hypothetical protein